MHDLCFVIELLSHFQVAEYISVFIRSVDWYNIEGFFKVKIAENTDIIAGSPKVFSG